MASYLPLTDAGFLSWSENFKDKIYAPPAPPAETPEGGQSEVVPVPWEAYGLTEAQATDYSDKQAAYAAAYAKAKHPDTRGGSTVLAKNEAKEALVALSRMLAMIATNHSGVTDQMRYDLGLTVRDDDPTPVPPPMESPVVEVVSVTGTKVELRLRAKDSSGRGKPTGVQGATVLVFVGEQAPTSVADWKFEGNTTKTSTNVVFDASLPPGAKVWLTAFWYNRKAQSGPACPPVSTHLQGGGVSGTSGISEAA